MAKHRREGIPATVSRYPPTHTLFARNVTARISDVLELGDLVLTMLHDAIWPRVMHRLQMIFGYNWSGMNGE